ncbi:MAG: ferrous iron transport protein B [Clostridia bacterium]|nr:ferrous iron transport protein B [Clostridia bacterium]
MEKRKTLDSLKIGESGYVHSFYTEDVKLRHRMSEMGITPGIEIKKIKAAPMGDPIEVSLRGYMLSLRRENAEKIFLCNEEDEEGLKCASRNVALDKEEDEAEHKKAALLTEFMIENVSCCDSEKRKNCYRTRKEPPNDEAPVKLALVGNPNCGKTTLFNALTGAREYVGNWPGVTVEKKEGKIKDKGGVCTHGHEMTLVDLPGIYSLSPYSQEEVIARNFIIDEKIDAIINIVDATNIERNLYLTVQLMELEVPMIIALNMMDEIEKQGDSIDLKELSLLLGIPIVPISARTGMGLGELADSMQRMVYAAHSQFHEGFNIEVDHVYDAFTREKHEKIGEIIKEYAQKAGMPLHWAEIKLLEGDSLVKERLKLDEESLEKVEAVIKEYSDEDKLMDNATRVADSRYRYITDIARKTVKRSKKNESGQTLDDKLDRVLTNKWLALPLFVGIMALIFTLTFSSVGAYLSDAVASLVDNTVIPFIETALISANAPEWFLSLVCGGILPGVGGVLTFLPQIAILFFCLSILEDSGYMSRIAFIMDKPMRKMGLSGKSFIPLLMGFGCSVPAVMGSRTVENEKDRQMTVMLVPFMSCSAKLPVYGLLAGAFFSRSRGLVIISLYVLGILIGILSGLIFKKTVFKDNDAEFIIELPRYRMPSMKNTFLHVWERVSHFLQKAGTIIFAMSVVLWALQNFSFTFEMVSDPQYSIIGKIGSFIAPIFTPLGFSSWQAVVALITGFVAKEAVVSTLTVFYGFSLAADSPAIMSALSGTFTTASAYSFLVFVLLYTPCIAAVTAMGKELHSKRKTAFILIYQLVAAYLVSFAVYNIASLFLA